MRKRIYRWLIFGIGFGLVSGCNDALTPSLPVPEAAKSVMHRPSPAAETAPPAAGIRLPAEEEDPVAVYNPVGKRDPFRSLIQIGERKIDPNLPPLQRTELSALRLTGVVWGDFGYEALVQTPDGRGYEVEVGTKIGINQGMVSRITPLNLSVEERSVDILGATHVATHVMELHPKKEGAE